jgi:arginine decarboxylase
LANEHNLFGAIHEAEIHITPDGDWQITKVTKGDPIDELLESRNYDMKEIFGSYEIQMDKALKEGRLSEAEKEANMAKLTKYVKTFPYLVNT